MMDELGSSTELVLVVLNGIPKSVREFILADASFRSKNGIEVDAWVGTDDEEVSLRQSELCSSIRALWLDSSASFKLRDASDKEWELVCVFVNEIRQFQITCNGKTYILPDSTELSNDKFARLANFEQQVQEANLPRTQADYWRQIISDRSLRDSELNLYKIDFANTPINLSVRIAQEIARGSVEIAVLVPKTESYFRQLVGDCANCKNIFEYEERGLIDHIKNIMTWHPAKGFKLVLLLAGHVLQPKLIDTSSLSDSEILEAYQWVAASGDIISQLGAVEIGLAIVAERPQIKPYLFEILMVIKDEDPSNQAGRFNLLSSLIVLVDGELSRSKILTNKPVFWRRLASIAHAAIIARGMVRSNINIEKFSAFVARNNGVSFYMQSFLDLRVAPRWLPEGITPKKLKDLFFGRLIAAANYNKAQIEKSELSDIFFSSEKNIFQSTPNFLDWLLPRPLEGECEIMAVIPTEIIGLIEGKLIGDAVQVNSFAEIINSASFFRIGLPQIELVGVALRKAKYQIQQIDNKHQLNSLLYGLAKVAAVTRSGSLAEDVFILTMNNWQLAGRELAPDDAMAIGLVAAAAYPALPDWSKFVGKWMTELAFQPLMKNDAIRLQTYCRLMCHRVPELWATCGKADAALEAITANEFVHVA